MFRILIVDDERVILNGCRFMIEKKMNLSFPVEVLTASNAETALRLVEEKMPQLIFTDIRMPVMSGLDFIRHIQEQDYSGRIVIITSHADFAYARDAIRLNVSDFILKPVDQEEMKRLILSTWHLYKKQLEEQREEIWQDLLYMMLYDSAASEFMASADLRKEIFPETYFTVIVLSAGALPEADFIEAVLGRSYSHCHCWKLCKRKQIVAVCNHEAFRVKPDAAFIQELYRLTGHGFRLGISIASNSPEDIPFLYMNAVQRIFYQETFGNDMELTEQSFFSYQDCIQIFWERDAEKALQLIGNYLARLNIMEGDKLSPVFLGRVYGSFFQNLSLYLQNIGQEEKVDVSPGVLPENPQELAERMMQTMDGIKERMRSRDSQPEADEQMKRIMRFIRLNYMRDISLDDLAEAAGLSPTYICALFKKNVGISFLTYLHQERMREAKLLLKSELPIDEIAGRVGYNSSTQFGRIFRKYENMSPSDYRKRQL